jgi:hypothetical protein
MIFERNVAQWLTSLRKDGFTALMIDEINKQTANIKYTRLLNLDEGGSPRWNSIADPGDDIEAKSKAAYAFSLGRFWSIPAPQEMPGGSM